MISTFLFAKQNVHYVLADPEHCDFLALRHAILGPRTRVLKQTTNEDLYEKFRTQKLIELKKLNRHPQTTSP